MKNYLNLFISCIILLQYFKLRAAIPIFSSAIKSNSYIPEIRRRIYFTGTSDNNQREKTNTQNLNQEQFATNKSFDDIKNFIKSPPNLNQDQVAVNKLYSANNNFSKSSPNLNQDQVAVNRSYFFENNDFTRSPPNLNNKDQVAVHKLYSANNSNIKFPQNLNKDQVAVFKYQNGNEYLNKSSLNLNQGKIENNKLKYANKNILNKYVPDLIKEDIALSNLKNANKNLINKSIRKLNKDQIVLTKSKYSNQHIFESSLMDQIKPNSIVKVQHISPLQNQIIMNTINKQETIDNKLEPLVTQVVIPNDELIIVNEKKKPNKQLKIEEAIHDKLNEILRKLEKLKERKDKCENLNEQSNETTMVPNKNQKKDIINKNNSEKEKCSCTCYTKKNNERCSCYCGRNHSKFLINKDGYDKIKDVNSIFNPINQINLINATKNLNIVVSKSNKDNNYDLSRDFEFRKPLIHISTNFMTNELDCVGNNKKITGSIVTNIKGEVIDNLEKFKPKNLLNENSLKNRKLKYTLTAGEILNADLDYLKYSSQTK